MIHKTAAALLFDLDETLISSIAATERVWGRWAAGHNLDVPVFLRTMHGRRAIELISALKLPGVDPRVDAAKIAAGELIDLDGIVQIAGARRFLQGLPSERWAIVTSAPRELAIARLAAADMPVPNILISAEDVRRGKPEPDGFLLAADRLGVPPKDCIVFEDAPAGIQAGEAAGATVVVVNALGSAHTRPAERPIVVNYDDVSVDVRSDSLVLHLPAPSVERNDH